MAYITIGIPTYNRSAFLQDAIRSVQEQSFKDVEILIVDDCSKDNTASICEKLARHDTRVHYVRNERNLGQAGNWKRIAELAVSPYVKYLMDDDLLLPGCLEQFVGAAQKWPECSLLACLSVNFNSDPGSFTKQQRVYAPEGPIPGEIMLRFLAHWSNHIGCPTNVMFRADVLHQVSDIWNSVEGVPWKYDILSFANGLRYGSFACIPRPLVAIRQHASSGTSALNMRKMQKEEKEMLLEIARLSGGAQSEIAHAEMHDARHALIRGIHSIRTRDFEEARFFIKIWRRSPHSFWALRTSLVMDWIPRLPVLIRKLLDALTCRILELRTVPAYHHKIDNLAFCYPVLKDYWQQEILCSESEAAYSFTKAAGPGESQSRGSG